MNYYKLTLIALITLTAISCGTEPEPLELKGIWQNEGLENQVVNALDHFNSIIFVAGKEKMFKKDISVSNNQWINLDLEITENSEFGDVLLYNEALFAVVGSTTEFHNLPDNYISLYKSMNEGGSWEPIQISLEGREKPNILGRIAEGNNSLYGDSHIIYKSEDNGVNWQQLTDISIIGVSEFLYVSKEHPNQIWTGGWRHIFSPYLAKSTDGGENWTLLDRNIAPDYMEATVFDVTISPNNENVVLAGLSSGIFKSTNGGETWKAVYGGIGRPIFQNSLQYQNRVYASGISQSGRLFVAVSNNYGNSWDIMEYEDGPVGVETNDMIVAEVEGNETLFFATNKGVYSLIFEE